MKSSLIALFSLLISTTSFADSMICSIEQIKSGVKKSEQVEVAISGASHGDIVTFTTDQFPQLSGFVSYYKGIAVIHMNAANGMGFSSHSDISQPNQSAYYQIILPSEGQTIDAVMVTCTLDKSQK